MQDMDRDPFKEYIVQTEPGMREKGYAWHTAIGLQAVDGLTPSKYLVQTAVQNIEGKITIDQAQQILDRYYEENEGNEDDRTEEADKVSVRIAKILAEQAFSFTPAEYISIHKKLFEGIYSHAGKMREINITKKEWVLDGATVLYASASDLEATLKYDFSQEKQFPYKGLSMGEIIRHLAVFVSHLWQIHIFAEGNTRTTAVFFIKYLRTLGFNVTNDIFAENAWYFRNALVRANYNNLKDGVHETTEYLELFLRNLLLDEKNPLHNRTMHISGAFSDEKKQDIDSQKQDIRDKKQDIGSEKQDVHTEKQCDDVTGSNDQKTGKTKFTDKTFAHIQKLYEECGDSRVFGRGDVMRILHLTESPSSELIRKLLAANLIEPVSGMGKGRYVFK